VPRRADRAAMEHARATLEQALLELTAKAESLAAGAAR
jgi:hypothetical protein